MAEAALVMSIVAVIAAIASAVSAWKSARYARRVAVVEEDRRHDELAPQLELVPHLRVIHRPEDDAHGKARRSYRPGALVTNRGPRSCSVVVRWEGEVRPPGDDPSGLIDEGVEPFAIVGELHLGSLAVGEGRPFSCTYGRDGETVTFGFVCSVGEDRTWVQRLAMVWPKMSDERSWPSSAHKRA